MEWGKKKEGQGLFRSSLSTNKKKYLDMFRARITTAHIGSVHNNWRTKNNSDSKYF